jgi:hypothetical protein
MRNKALIAVLAAVLVLLGWRISHGPLSAPAPGQASAQSRPGVRGSESRPSPARLAPAALRAEPPAPAPGTGDAEARRERSAWTLASYLDWAQYPPSSRPARERPDRARPHAVSARRLPLAKEGGGHSETNVVLWQSHLYLAGSERAVLTVACKRGDEPVACAVLGAAAAPELPVAGLGAVPIAFADDGAGADKVAGDGVLTATFAPGEQGFGKITGPLRVQLDVDAGGERGTATFALSYTAAAPATFTGTVHERLAGGSLELCLDLRVGEPGRYVLDGRVDDASGETFAFVTFNEVLAEGVQEACFQIFGKLVRDEGARAPFTLRDVEGLLLLEDAFPDRHTLPAWEGAVHTTKAYSADDFAAEAWQSETKTRYVTALQKGAGSAGDED